MSKNNKGTKSQPQTPDLFTQEPSSGQEDYSNTSRRNSISKKTGELWQKFIKSGNKSGTTTPKQDENNGKFDPYDLSSKLTQLSKNEKNDHKLNIDKHSRSGNTTPKHKSKSYSNKSETITPKTIFKNDFANLDSDELKYKSVKITKEHHKGHRKSLSNILKNIVENKDIEKTNINITSNKTKNLDDLITSLTSSDRSEQSAGDIANLLKKCIEDLKGEVPRSSEPNSRTIFDVVISLSKEPNTHFNKFANASSIINIIINKIYEIDSAFFNIIDIYGHNFLHKLMLSNVDRKEIAYGNLIDKMNTQSLSSNNLEHGNVLHLLAKDIVKVVNNTKINIEHINIILKKFADQDQNIDLLFVACDAEDRTFLHNLAYHSYSDIDLINLITNVIKLISQHCREVLLSVDKLGNTPLIAFAQSEDTVSYSIMHQLIYQMQNTRNGFEAIKAVNNQDLNFLHAAAIKGHCEFFSKKTLESIAKIEPDITKDTIFKATSAHVEGNILQLAILNNHSDIVKILSNNDNYIDKLIYDKQGNFITDSNGNTVLHQALLNNKYSSTNDIVSTIINKYPTLIAIANNEGITPVHLVSKFTANDSLLNAIEAPDNETLYKKVLLYQDARGYTALTYAIVADNSSATSRLLKNAGESADQLIEKSSVANKNILEFAYDNDKSAVTYTLLNLEFSRVLLKAFKENILHKALEDGKGQLALAIIKSNKGESLINADKKSMTVSSLDLQGNTILHKVLSTSYTNATVDIVAYLINKYPQLLDIIENNPNSAEQYPIHLVISKSIGGDLDIKKKLVELFTKGKKISNLYKEDGLGHTILDIAIKNGNIDLVSFILNIYPKSSNNKNQYIIHKSVIESSPAFVLELCKLKPELLNKKDIEGKSPLDLALEKHNKNKDDLSAKVILNLLLFKNSYIKITEESKVILVKFVIDRGDHNLLNNILSKYPKLLDYKDQSTSNNLMHLAIDKNKSAIVELLYALNNKLANELNKDNMIPLDLGIKQDNINADTNAAIALINCYPDPESRQANQDYYDSKCDRQLSKSSQGWINLNTSSTFYSQMPTPKEQDCKIIDDSIIRSTSAKIIDAIHEYVPLYDVILLDTTRLHEFTLSQQVTNSIELNKSLIFQIDMPEQSLSLMIIKISDDAKASIIHLNSLNHKWFEHKLLTEIFVNICSATDSLENNFIKETFIRNVPVPQSYIDKDEAMINIARCIIENKLYNLDELDELESSKKDSFEILWPNDSAIEEGLSKHRKDSMLSFAGDGFEQNEEQVSDLPIIGIGQPLANDG